MGYIVVVARRAAWHFGSLLKWWDDIVLIIAGCNELIYFNKKQLLLSFSSILEERN